MREGSLLGLIQGEGEGLRLTIYSTSGRHRIAIVQGSARYLACALIAVGLASPVAPLAKNRDRPRLALVGRQPANRGP